MEKNFENKGKYSTAIANWEVPSLGNDDERRPPPSPASCVRSLSATND